jgi:hypothetical protein
VSLALVVACQSAPDDVEPAWLPGAGAELPAPPPGFSGERALADARGLVRHAERSPASRAAARVRRDIERALHEMGARVEVLGPTGAAGADAPGGDRPMAEEVAAAGVPAIVGSLPGRSDDVLLLVAAYGATGPDEAAQALELADAASGAAVLLELGRALSARPRPYTVWLAFVEGGVAGRGVEGDAGAGDTGTPGGEDDGAAARIHPGSAALADALAQRGDRERVRVAVFFDSLAHPDLRVARDLRSHRIHRETFWDSARALGLEDVFVAEEPLSSPESGHVALLERDWRGVVAIVGATPPALPVDEDEAEPLRPDAAEDATVTRLDELGTVVLDALDRIAARLARIDGFVNDGLAGEDWGTGPSATGRSAPRPADPPPSTEGASPDEDAAGGSPRSAGSEARPSADPPPPAADAPHGL